MEEKRKNLESEKQKRLLQRLVGELSHSRQDFYYRSTSEIAFLIKGYISGDANLSVEERGLLAPLSESDIQIRLSLH